LSGMSFPFTHNMNQAIIQFQPVAQQNAVEVADGFMPVTGSHAAHQDIHQHCHRQAVTDILDSDLSVARINPIASWIATGWGC